MFRGDRLKQLREARQYTHAELAALLDVGYAQINRYEAGRTTPAGDVIVRIAEVFNVSTDYLLGLTDDQTPHFRVDNLSAKERAILSAVRHGDPMEAIRIIANDS
jgi:transcriptional regulator with XRE-family HTH domain